MTMRETVVASPIGPLRIAAEDGAIVAVRFQGEGDPAPAAGGGPADEAVLREAAEQLAAWFGGEREGFRLPLAPRGTPFQQEVWRALLAIPAGQTRTYGALAAALGRPAAARAVGAACARNPLGILVPCHRAVGSDGRLTGYAWGLGRKRWLLDRERA
jgi:methylated-DNA-[protein]-cysteine S-methyltransferase